jgi:hypothetical protein
MPDKRSIVRGLLLVGGIAVAVALLAAFQMLAGGRGSLLALIPVVASLGCFGLLLRRDLRIRRTVRVPRSEPSLAASSSKLGCRPCARAAMAMVG